MLLEDLRLAHESIERLEAGISDRILDDPKQLRARLARDHEISAFLNQIQSQSTRALHIYSHEQEARTAEVQAISTGDVFEEFYKQLNDIKEYQKRYPNAPVENLERAYKKAENGGPGFAGDIDGMFTGEEAFGRFFDLTMLHEEYLNLPGIRGARKLTYLQYLDTFDHFAPPQCTISRQDKMTDEFFSYVGSLAQYLESFIRRIKPLEDLGKLFGGFDEEFDQSWEKDEVAGWEAQKAHTNGTAANGPKTEGTGEGIWCADCEKEFKNDNVYKAHLTGKKHVKNAEALSNGGDAKKTNGAAAVVPAHGERLKERAVAEREHRIRKLASSMTTEREDTRVNVERKAGMTDRERQQELAALYAEDEIMTNAPNGRTGEDGEEGDDEEKIYNPLKLPLAWDGKPIPFWLYKLHGLGVEFSCEICGNYVYMGRRAFDKHFSEARHVYGLKCLGIGAQTGLFAQITGIEEAQRLWEKVQRDKKEGGGVGGKKGGGEAVEEMEDSQGNVMPKKVYEDLRKAGLL
ncbi:Pre-mRNA-splicing factor sap61 [Recurvomyces mirabilis]|uniref:Pre-mRNA-splicing factor sap61 n=1 Tax=Recurvomyces mirabilis TaxID=574656 RepID=A0AAE1C6H2_9PEZI|nr:Pre-mRNA-splicing factor sap61 [Recurvomyces mirabilis]